MLKYFWIFPAILLLPDTAYCQEFRLTYYNVEDGLPTNFTKSVASAPDGSIWVATDDGLCRFNGNQFLPFDQNIPSPLIKSFWQRKNGNLLVAHDHGVSEITYHQETIESLLLLPASSETSGSGIAPPKTLSLFEDQDQNLWVSEPQSIVKFSQNTLKRYRFPEEYKSGSFLRSFVFCYDGYDSFLAASQTGFLFHYNKAKDQFVNIPLPFPVQNINTLYHKGNGVIWIGSNEGLFELTLSQKQTIIEFKKIHTLNKVSDINENEDFYFVATHFNGLFLIEKNIPSAYPKKMEELNFRVINFVHIAKNGDIWISGDEGLALLQPYFFTKITFDSNVKYINTLSTLPNGTTLISDGSQVLEIKGHKHLQDPTIIFQQPNDNISGLHQHNNYVYITTTKGKIITLNRQTGTHKTFQLPSIYGSAYSPIIDPNGHLWVCVQFLHGVIRILPDEQFQVYGTGAGFLNNVYSFQIDNHNNLYCIGLGLNSYLYQYNPRTDTFENLSKPLKFKHFESLSIHDLVFDTDNKMYLSSNQGILVNEGDGLAKIDLKQSIQLNYIKGLAVDKEGGIWAGTDIGLIRYFNGHTFIFNEFDGLPGRTLSYKGISIDTNNHVWVGTNNGAACSRKNALTYTQTPKPAFSFIGFNGRKELPEKPNLPFQSALQAGIYTPVYPNQKLILEYKISNLTNQWQQLEGRLLSIANLKEGMYQLQVRAIQQGAFTPSEPLTYSFSVQLPWYKTWWILTAIILILAGLIWLFVILNTIRLRKDKERLEKIICERTSKIVEQKNEIQKQTNALKDAFEKIKSQNEKLELLNATKDKFFSIVAHDLRGPLSSLYGFADLLANPNAQMNPEEVKFIATDLRKSLKNTLSLAENLLTWARGQMNNLGHKPQEVNVNEAIIRVREISQILASNKKIIIQLNLDADVFIMADPEHLHFILRNLLSNAIKFSKPKSEITISSRLTGEHVEISVIDSGIGMSSEEIHTIFDIDAKSSRPGTEGEKGTGLGLILCKEFASKNKATISVSSNQKGCCFTITCKTVSTPAFVLRDRNFNEN
jgi:signal transduction histidine kinase